MAWCKLHWHKFIVSIVLTLCQFVRMKSYAKAYKYKQIILLLYDQLWAASLIGWNAVMWRWSLSNDQRVTVDRVVCHYNDKRSMLWRCWLGSRKGIRPVKTEWWGTAVVICLLWGADLHMAQLMSLPLTVSCFSKIQIGFTFLVPAHLGSPGQRAVNRVCVCLFTWYTSYRKYFY